MQSVGQGSYILRYWCVILHYHYYYSVVLMTSSTVFILLFFSCFSNFNRLSETASFAKYALLLLFIYLVALYCFMGFFISLSFSLFLFLFLEQLSSICSIILQPLFDMLGQSFVQVDIYVSPGSHANEESGALKINGHTWSDGFALFS